MNRLVSPRPGARRTEPATGVLPSSPKAIMCSHRNAAPALVPATGTPGRIHLPHSLGDRRAADQGREPQLIAAGEKDARWPAAAARAGRAPRRRAGYRNPAMTTLRAPISLKIRLIARRRLARQAGGGNDRDIRRGAAAQFHESPQDLRGILLVLCTSDRNDPPALAAFRYFTCTHAFEIPSTSKAAILPSRRAAVEKSVYRYNHRQRAPRQSTELYP